MWLEFHVRGLFCLIIIFRCLMCQCQNILLNYLLKLYIDSLLHRSLLNSHSFCAEIKLTELAQSDYISPWGKEISYKIYRLAVWLLSSAAGIPQLILLNYYKRTR